VLPSDAKVHEMSEQSTRLPAASGGKLSAHNCIGTGLVLGKPIQIRLDEHYLPIIKEWYTCSAPIPSSY